jgi:hypothetical protein
MALTEQGTAWLTTHFSASETNVLEERELQNGCALRMLVYKRAEHVPSFQKKECPVTPGVPALLD